MELPFLKPADLVGVDLGTSSVKVVHLKAGGSKTAVTYSLVRYGVAPISVESTADLSPQERKDKTVEALRTLIRESGITVRRAATSLSGNSLIVRYVKFPRLAASELEKTITFEAEPYIPFNINEVNIGFQILGDVVDDGQKKMETILVAAKKDVIQSRVEVLYEAGLRPAVIDVDALAIGNCFDIGRNREVSESVLCVNIGASTTNICIIEDGVAKVVRDVFIAGNNLTRAIQKNLQVEYKAAEEMKARYGLVVRGDPEGEPKLEGVEAERYAEVSTVLTPVIKELLGEVQRSVEYYVAQAGEKERTVNRVILLGGTANLKNLDRYFARTLNLPVEIGNPFANITVSPPALSGDRDKPLIPAMAIAVGLAVRREGDSRK